MSEATFTADADEETRRLAALAESAGLNASATAQSLWLDGWLMRFAPVKARYFKFVARHALEKQHAVVAEIGIVVE